MNPFETGERKLIPAVLVYARRDGRVLMIHRDSVSGSAAGAGSARPADYHAGKWNGLGGKCELDESPLEAAQRELREESGLEPPESAFRALGVIQFPSFKAHKSEDWVVYVFTVSVGAGARALERVDEGSLHWIPEGDILSLNLWAGDRHFIPHVLAEEPFMGTIWYRGQEVVRHWVARLGLGGAGP